MYFVCTDKNDNYKYFAYNESMSEVVDQKCKFRTGLNTDTYVLYISRCSLYISRCFRLTDRICYLRVVNIPNNTYSILKIHNEDCSSFVIKTNSVILSDRYYLYDPKTIKQFNIKVNSEFISYACVNGAVKFLEWWKNSGLPLKYNRKALDYASAHGRINVLEWWLKSGLKLKYSNNALGWASSAGHINVLDWWKNSSLELKYTEGALDWASFNGHVNVLEWWKNSGLHLKYTDDALTMAPQYGHVDASEWWIKSGLELKYNRYYLTHYISNNVISNNVVVKWWNNSGLLKN